MGGLLLLLALSVVMALASFLAGALPLSMTLSQSQLRLISSIGIGILVGTSLIVIMPEGIEAIASRGVSSHSHNTRSRALSKGLDVRWNTDHVPNLHISRDDHHDHHIYIPVIASRESPAFDTARREESQKESDTKDEVKHPEATAPEGGEEHSESELPTFYIGFSLILGFVLMFLIDRLPRHATENFQSPPATRHISLDNLASSNTVGDEESDSFLGSLAPTPKQSRSLATTTGLVIHAAADGIAMGASATSSDMKLGFIIFFAIMIHKAPAAFGLTSVLLKQGLSKRAARGHLIVFSLASPFGALATYLAISLIGGGNMEGESGKWWTGMLLLFSAGTFLYVAMHAMQEDHGLQGHDHHSSANGYSDASSSSQRKQGKPQMRDTIATVIGMLFPLLAQFGHHH
ncbi:Zinc/iron permease [Phialemonium atrogriseum]|uniref:Zinc/iron permease n=1 Tax=Phialemonium atrogriseum TaxID=1093897 RepID=A0AAJ0FNL8_9PEZI|nr:Zinc/iron permease [Phialemonium atrogriseum]KAK1769139.1 Zinc/iron permease [Phialemonium atrogriseum]